MSSDLKSDLASFFKPPKPRSLEDCLENIPAQNKKDLLRDGYVRSNQSLVLKVHRLEAELARSRKLVEALRDENASLRRKVYDTERLNNRERIEALAEERIKSKMDQLKCISLRAVDHLQKTALDLKNAFEDFGVLVETSSTLSNDIPSKTKRSILISEGEPSLCTVAESPPLAVNGARNCMDTKENQKTFQGKETPSRAHSGTGSKFCRRSQLFRYGQEEIAVNSETIPSDIPETSVVEVGCSSVSTPPVLSKRPFFETPAVVFSECDTVRRKRTATLKIKTMVEPKLNNKLRRPGRNDEPHPFISSLY